MRPRRLAGDIHGSCTGSFDGRKVRTVGSPNTTIDLDFVGCSVGTHPVYGTKVVSVTYTWDAFVKGVDAPWRFELDTNNDGHVDATGAWGSQFSVTISFATDTLGNHLTQVDVSVSSDTGVVAPNGSGSTNNLEYTHACSGTLAGDHPDLGHCLFIAGSNRFYWVSGGTWTVTWNHGE